MDVQSHRHSPQLLPSDELRRVQDEVEWFFMLAPTYPLGFELLMVALATIGNIEKVLKEEA